MKHKKIGFFHLICGKQGHKGKRKLSAEIAWESNQYQYLLGVTIRLIFFFLGVAVDIEKKEEKKENVSQETANDDSVQGP